MVSSKMALALLVALSGRLFAATVATTGDVTLDVPEWKSGDREWPSVFPTVVTRDWSGYDRLAVDVSNLGDGGDQVTLCIAGAKGRMGEGLRRSFELPAWETVRWEMPLNYWEDSAAKSNEVARLQLYAHKPKCVHATFSGFTLLKPGEAAPEVRTPPGLVDALRRGRADYEHRLREERRTFVAELKAANARDGVRNGKMLYGVGTAMEQVRPKRTRTLRSAAEVRMRLARNEWEGRQIFVTPAEGALKGVSVGVSTLVHADGKTVFPAAEIRVLMQGYVKTRRFPRYGVGYDVPTNAAPGYVRLAKRADLGWWPDMLLDFLPTTDIAAGDVQGFWISVHAPEGQLAGDYRGRVTISAADAPAITLPFLVHVNGFDLPKTPVIPTLVSFNPSVHVAKGREHEYGDIARAFRADQESPINMWSRHRMEWADFLADHFITMAPLYHHGLELPYDVWDRLKAQGRMGLYNLCYFGVGAGQKTSPEELEKWGKWVKSVIAKNYEKAKEHGLEKNCLVYCCDEAPTNRFPAIDAVVTMMKDKFPDITFVTTSYDDLFGTGDLLRKVDVFCPQPHKMDTALADRSRAEGHKVWWYFANCQLAPQANIFTECQPSEIRLFMGAMAARYRPDGFLYYQCAYFNNRRCVTTGPYTDWDPRSFRDEHGDATWVAVGPDGRPLTTVRLENFRDGLEDLAYVKLVEKRSGRRVKVPESLVESLKNYTDDPEAIEAWRNRLADYLETEAF